MKKKVTNFRNKIKVAYLAAMLTICAVPASCTGGAGGFSVTPATINSGTNPTTAVSNILGLMLQIGIYIGSALAIWGGVMFGMAIKNDEPESKQKALMVLIAGIILIAIRFVMQALGVITV